MASTKKPAAAKSAAKKSTTKPPADPVEAPATVDAANVDVDADGIPTLVDEESLLEDTADADPGSDEDIDQAPDFIPESDPDAPAWTGREDG